MNFALIKKHSISEDKIEALRNHWNLMLFITIFLLNLADLVKVEPCNRLNDKIIEVERFKNKNVWVGTALAFLHSLCNVNRAFG